MPDANAERCVIGVVDDDANIRAALGRLLRSFGCEARLYDGAAAFLSSVSRAEMACVLVDLQMPGIGGVELIRELAGRHPELPAIAMTAYPSEAIRDRALGAGAAAFLTKPFDAARLEGCLSELGLRPNP